MFWITRENKIEFIPVLNWNYRIAVSHSVCIYTASVTFNVPCHTWPSRLLHRTTERFSETSPFGPGMIVNDLTNNYNILIGLVRRRT